MEGEIRTGSFDVCANHTSVELFNAMTPAMSTADMKEVRFAVWLSGLGLLKVKIGVQFSNDGLVWDSAAYLTVAGGFATATGWTFDPNWIDLTGIGGTTHRLFVRFGVGALTTSGTASQGGQAELRIQVKPKSGSTMTVGPIQAWCKTTSAQFIPMSQPIPSDQVGEIRGTVELQASTGDLGIKCAWREADTPTVQADWSGSTSFGTEKTSDGIAYGTTFSSPSITKKFVQFGVDARNTSANAIEAGQATIRIDYRT